jgi:hypothetical protein
MKASTLSFRIACLFALAGISMGIGMAASGDHSLMPAHAHLNLLGWVSLFLFGVYYHLYPAVGAKRLAMTHVVAWSAGTFVLILAVAALHLGYGAFEPLAAIGSLVMLAAFGIFTVLVFRSGAPARSPAVSLTPAE